MHLNIGLCWTLSSVEGTPWEFGLVSEQVLIGWVTGTVLTSTLVGLLNRLLSILTELPSGQEELAVLLGPCLLHLLYGGELCCLEVNLNWGPVPSELGLEYVWQILICNMDERTNSEQRMIERNQWTVAWNSRAQQQANSTFGVFAGLSVNSALLGRQAPLSKWQNTNEVGIYFCNHVCEGCTVVQGGIINDPVHHSFTSTT